MICNTIRVWWKEKSPAHSPGSSERKDYIENAMNKKWQWRYLHVRDDIGRSSGESRHCENGGPCPDLFS